MSIFVTNDIFEFSFNCKKILSNSGQFIGYKVDNLGDVKIVCKYIGRSFNKMSKVIEDSSIINSATGKPMLRTSILCKLILTNFIKSIILIQDGIEETVNINSETSNNMHYELVKEISKKWLEITGGK